MGEMEEGKGSQGKNKLSLLFIRNWIGLFVMGLINNLSYVVVSSASQAITQDFRVPNLIGIIPWANIAFGLLSQVTNGFILEKRVPHFIRVVAFCIVSMSGLIGIALSIYIGFWFAVLSIIFVGASSAFGESVMLGYMKKFPPTIVSAWSSGTGMAGLTGSMLYLLFTSLQFSITLSFILLVPLIIIYFIMFTWVLKDGPIVNEIDNSIKNEQNVADTAIPPDNTSISTTFPSNQVHSPTDDLIHAPSVEEKHDYGTQFEDGFKMAQPNAVIEDNVSLERSQLIMNGNKPQETIIGRYWRVFKFCWWRAFNLLLVYLFEYIISIGCANKAQPRGFEKSHYWPQQHAFEILSFCYAVGVIISRSSLPIIKIRRIEWITIFQGLNLCVWLYASKFKILNVWVQFPLMIFVGLLGGASYVNVYYLLLMDKRVNAHDRELSINMTAIGVTMGITSASLCILAMDNTIFKYL